MRYKKRISLEHVMCFRLIFLHCISIIYVGDGQKSVPTRETGDCCDDHKTHVYFASEEMERN